jgi:hypothetical protein
MRLVENISVLSICVIYPCRECLTRCIVLDDVADDVYRRGGLRHSPIDIGEQGEKAIRPPEPRRRHLVVRPTRTGISMNLCPNNTETKAAVTSEKKGKGRKRKTASRIPRQERERERDKKEEAHG